jgi:predicted RND superfamily exporter protein
MEDEFSQAMPNASVMVKNVSVTEALVYKDNLAAIDGVTQVLWLDDMIDMKQPLVLADADTVESFYKDGNALFSVTIRKGMENTACDAILNLIGEDNALTGEAPAQVKQQKSGGAEVMKAMMILLPIIILILVLSTTSWIEPILFLAVIGISIVINMGTNSFLGSVSFVTNSVTPILQLACSLDYAIFLLHSFTENRKKYPDVEEAMKHSVKESMSTIAASAMTTLFGFLALVFMDFGIGADLGMNLAKGIVLSFISVMVLLPALTLGIYKLIDKTQHRALMPSFKNVNKVLSKIAIPAVVVVVLIIVPAFLGQGHTRFTYSNKNDDITTRSGRDSAAIQEMFGKSTVVALLVPRGDVAKELELCNELKSLDHVTGVTSYTSTVGATIPAAFVGSDITDKFYSEHFTRIIIYTDTPSEGEVAFATVDSIGEKAGAYYGDAVTMAGASANTNDMKKVVAHDNGIVNLLAIIAIFFVLLITFRSLSLPLILLLTIETGIWINLSIPYFSGITIGFMGYLIISSVQLGATVDYAILLSTNYMRQRRLMPKHEAISESLGQSFRPILISGSILATAGFTLSFTSSTSMIYEMGLLVGRGALLSMGMVMCFLPAMLMLLDRAIAKTTLKSNFFRKQKDAFLEEHHEKTF